MDQPDPGDIAPDQDRASRHEIRIHIVCQNDSVVVSCPRADEVLERFEPDFRIRQRVRKIEDRIVLALPVNPMQFELSRRRKVVEHHRPRLVHRRKLRGVAKQNQAWKNLFQILELAIVKHRSFVDKTDIERLFAPFPANDEIRSSQTGSRQRAGYGTHGSKESLGAVQSCVRQPFDVRPFATASQPFRDLFVFRIVDRRIENSVDRGRGDAMRAQNACRLVGRSENCQRPAVFALAALVIAGNDIDTRIGHGLGQFRKQHRLAGPGFSDDCKHTEPRVMGRVQVAFLDIDAGLFERL